MCLACMSAALRKLIEVRRRPRPTLVAVEAVHSSMSSATGTRQLATSFAVCS
jgi:hypothetical protein